MLFEVLRSAKAAVTTFVYWIDLSIFTLYIEYNAVKYFLKEMYRPLRPLPQLIAVTRLAPLGL